MQTKPFSQAKIFTYILLLSLSFAGCNPTNNDRDSDVAIPVSVTEAGLTSISEFLQTTGTVQAVQTADLVTRIEGDYHLEINPRTGSPYALGDRIPSGETIVNLKNREFELNIQLESVRLEQKLSSQEYEKQQALYEKGGVTLRELTNAEKAFINARTALEEAQLNLDKLSIEAPFTGVITQLPYFTQGTHLPASTLVARIMDYRELILEVNFPEKAMDKIKTGQQVKVNHYSLENKNLDGWITEISPAVDPETRMFDVKIRVKNPRKSLRPGMFVKANVMVEHKDSVITLPREVVLEKNDRQVIYVVEKDRAIERRVVTGLESDDRIEILDGLEKEERVVTDGYETLRNRSKVKVLR